MFALSCFSLRLLKKSRSTPMPEPNQRSIHRPRIILQDHRQGRRRPAWAGGRANRMALRDRSEKTRSCDAIERWGNRVHRASARHGVDCRLTRSALPAVRDAHLSYMSMRTLTHEGVKLYRFANILPAQLLTEVA